MDNVDSYIYSTYVFKLRGLQIGKGDNMNKEKPMREPDKMLEQRLQNARTEAWESLLHAHTVYPNDIEYLREISSVHANAANQRGKYVVQTMNWNLYQRGLLHKMRDYV